jgi:hypothetical protein
LSPQPAKIITRRVGVLRQDVWVGQNPVEDELTDSNKIAQVCNRKNLAEDRFKSDVEPVGVTNN